MLLAAWHSDPEKRLGQTSRSSGPPVYRMLALERWQFGLAAYLQHLKQHKGWAMLFGCSWLQEQAKVVTVAGQAKAAIAVVQVKAATVAVQDGRSRAMRVQPVVLFGIHLETVAAVVMYRD
jgi:hypothetical protein